MSGVLMLLAAIAGVNLFSLGHKWDRTEAPFAQMTSIALALCAVAVLLTGDSGSKPDRAETPESGSVHESHGGDSQSPEIAAH